MPPRALCGAVVGAGLMGRWHADALVRAGGRLTLVVDTDLQRARALAAQYRGCRAEVSLSVDAGSSPVDVAHICTPASTHEQLVVEAVRNRMHVLVEKPLAATAEATKRVCRQATMAGVLVCPVHQFIFQRGVVAALDALPQLSPICQVDAVACSAGANGEPDHVRDAVAVDILPHAVSLVLRLLPDVPRGEWHVFHPRAGELMITTESGGANVSVAISMAGRPTCNWLRIVGERGTVFADLFHGFAVFQGPSVSRARKILQPFAQAASMSLHAAVNLSARAIRREPAYPGLRELVRRFYDAVRSGGPSPIPADEAVAVAGVRDAVLDSLSLRTAFRDRGDVF